MKLARNCFLLALLIFFALFGLRLSYVLTTQPDADIGQRSREWSEFSYSKKNYASSKMEIAPIAGGRQSLGNAEKYEKIASIGQTSRAFEDDNRKILGSVEKHRGTVQYEALDGLPGQRRLALGIGVPPDAFDAFIDEVKAIGRLTFFSIVKNDKTNEYQQLRANRASLEKAKAAVDALRVHEASVKERLELEARSGEIEEQIQQLGVSLGEFDTQNEFYTVKLSLQEVRVPIAASWKRQIFNAFVWSVEYFTLLGLGLLLCAAGLFLGQMALRGLWNFIQSLPKS